MGQSAEIDVLAQAIRVADGSHNLGAGALAEALMPTVREFMARAWDEAAQALAWCMENGPDEGVATHVAANNPYRATSPEQQATS